MNKRDLFIQIDLKQHFTEIVVLLANLNLANRTISRHAKMLPRCTLATSSLYSAYYLC